MADSLPKRVRATRSYLPPKFGFNGTGRGNPNAGGARAKNIQRALEASLKRLGTDYIVVASNLCVSATVLYRWILRQHIYKASAFSRLASSFFVCESSEQFVTDVFSPERQIRRLRVAVRKVSFKNTGPSEFSRVWRDGMRHARSLCAGRRLPRVAHIIVECPMKSLSGVIGSS